jgi:hypothetical protein
MGSGYHCTDWGLEPPDLLFLQLITLEQRELHWLATKIVVLYNLIQRVWRLRNRYLLIDIKIFNTSEHITLGLENFKNESSH